MPSLPLLSQPRAPVIDDVFTPSSKVTLRFAPILPKVISVVDRGKETSSRVGPVPDAHRSNRLTQILGQMNDDTSIHPIIIHLAQIPGQMKVPG